MRTMIFATAAAAVLLAACGDNNNAADVGDTGAMNAVQDAASVPVGSASAMMANTAAEFVPAAAMSDMYEIEAGKIAAERATRPDVKAFGASMVEHHTKMSNDMKKTVADAGLNLPPPAALDDRRNGLLNNLRTADAADFDRVYLNQQVAAHEEALSLMRNFAENGDNAPLQAAAGKAAPMVEGHLNQARTLNGEAPN